MDLNMNDIILNGMTIYGLLAGCGASPTGAPAPTSDADIQDAGGRTALHAEVEDGQIEVVRYLLRYGANADIQDVGGRTAMHAAAEDGQIEIVRLLVEAGADVTIETELGQIPLDLAEGEDVIEILRQAGAAE
jgi:ankyrin repeat protein